MRETGGCSGGEWRFDGVLHRRGFASDRSGSPDPAVMGTRASRQTPADGSGVSPVMRVVVALGTGRAFPHKLNGDE